MDKIVYRIKTGKKLLSFGDEIKNVPVCGMTLAERQKEAVQLNSCKLIDIESEDEIEEIQYLVFDDDLFFTEEFFKKVLLSNTSNKSSKQYCLEKNKFNDRYVLSHSINIEENLQFAFYFRNKEIPETILYEIQQKLYDYEIILTDRIVKNGKYYVGRSKCFISRIASPFHLLYVNLAFNVIRTIAPEKIFSGWLFNRFGNPESRLYYLGLKMMNRIGKNCQIHPSAIIEASVLGDNVCVGANSVVRFSQIGSGSSISDNVVVINCVAGENNVIANSNFLSFNLLFNNVFMIHGPYQFSVFGNSSSAFAVINCDIRLDEKTVKIPTDEGVIDSGQQLLGIAYGHYSKVGGGNTIAAGRIVPNHRIINPPGNIILKFD